MRWTIVADYEALSLEAASILLAEIRSDPRAVLGLPTGRTPEGMYAVVVRECSSEYRCFREVTTFNLDEYAGIETTHPGSYASYMRERLIDHVDLRDENVHIPDGSPNRRDRLSLDEALEAECEAYERAIVEAGGLTTTFLGLGSNGHIAFNEPGTPFDSRTHVVELTESTRRANAAFFPDRDVPRRAITMGIATILSSRSIVLLASGEAKANAVARLAAGTIDPSFPASALHGHRDVRIIVDRAARAALHVAEHSDSDDLAKWPDIPMSGGSRHA